MVCLFNQLTDLASSTGKPAMLKKKSRKELVKFRLNSSKCSVHVYGYTSMKFQANSNKDTVQTRQGMSSTVSQISHHS